MEMLQRIFRVLVVISAVMSLTWIFSRRFLLVYFDENVQKLLGADGYGSVVPFPEILFWVLLSVSLICYLGLFFFKRWAVWLLIVLDLIVVVVLAPFAGVEVSAPLERIAKTLYLMADGALISLAFFSDLKFKFAKKLGDGKEND